MRILLLTALAFGALAVLPAAAEDTASTVDYRVEIDHRSVFSAMRENDGKASRIVSLQFKIKRLRDDTFVTSVPKEEIVVTEDGKKVASLEIHQPKAQKLTTVLVMDVSGSMERNNKIDAARKAALAFLDKMDERAGVGLILFDHEIRVTEPPVTNPAKQAEHRAHLRQLINKKAIPKGGTAYHDATIEAVKMLRGIAGRRAVVLMTDGADTNSKSTLAEAITAAKIGEVPVYTLGIGEPGKNDPITTVLVLDRSGSMLEKADEKDKLTKIEALKRAANRFVALMRPSAQTTLLPFSSKRDDGSDGIDPALPLTRDPAVLRARIENLKAFGGTLLYDATFQGIETLEASGVKGKRAVVVMTDGKDEAPGSRVSDDQVIERAKELDIPLYMLGLGRLAEINEPVMKKMAEATKGKYYHAGNEKKLLELFENLSIELHDDGIDEESLQKLAKETGGKYTHVSKMSELQFIYEQLADELQNTYRVTFESNRASHDGTARGIDVDIVDATGKKRSSSARVDYVTRGVVVPQMSYGVYVAFLAGLCVLLAFPAVIRRMYRGYGGT
jgi:VWFA-related protein